MKYIILEVLVVRLQALVNDTITSVLTMMMMLECVCVCVCGGGVMWLFVVVRRDNRPLTTTARRITRTRSLMQTKFTTKSGELKPRCCGQNMTPSGGQARVLLIIYTHTQLYSPIW